MEPREYETIESRPRISVGLREGLATMKCVRARANEEGAERHAGVNGGMVGRGEPALAELGYAKARRGQ
jgi:hypothetical protein